jgi:hypothetical protein
VRKKLSWIYKRWKVLDHPSEDIYRVKQIFQMQVLDRIAIINSTKKKTHQFTSNYQINLARLQKLWNPHFECARFKFYDCSIDNVFEISNWRLDAKSKKKSTIKFSNSINGQDYEKNGDVRYVSTMSRLHFLPYLVSESILKKDNEKLNNVYHILKNWNEDNPYLKSINWKSGIEVSIRSLNLDLTRGLLEKSSLKNTIVQSLISLIDTIQNLNYKFLKTHLSYYSSANNHLLYELVGLFYLASSYNFKGNKYWQDRTSAELQKELTKQTHKDGFSKEQSTHYHAEVLNIYCLYFSRAQVLSVPLNDIIIERFRAMFYALILFLKDDGTIWQIGDSDDGQIVYPYFDSGFKLYNSLLIHFDHFFSERKEDDLRTIFYPSKILNKASEKNNLVKSDFCDLTPSGYFIFKNKKSHIVFDIGPIGYGALAAHGHADILQILFRHNSEDILIDPGTFQYHSKFIKWRDYFRGTSSHNTITINELDQSKSGGRMMWTNKPKVALNLYNENLETVMIEAIHDGFIQQKINVLHTRKVTLFKNENKLIIEDSLLAPENEEYTFCFSLNFGDLKVELIQDTVFLSSKKNNVSITNKHFGLAHIHKGNKVRPSGWISKGFNSKIVSEKLELSINTNGNFSMLTEVNFCN